MPECPLCHSDVKRLTGILFHDDSTTVYVDGAPVELTGKEYRTLKTIYESGIRGASPAQIVETLYTSEADEPEWPEEQIPVLVCKIRRKLKSGRLQVETIRGEYGAGLQTRRYRALILT